MVPGVQGLGQGNVYNGNGDVLRISASGVDSTPAPGSYLAAYPELFDNLGQVGYFAHPNNVKDMFNTGRLFENSVNINGGEGNTTFSMTASNVNHLGYVENSGYVRNNISVGGQTKFKNLTLGGNVSFARSKQKTGVIGGGSAFNSIWPLPHSGKSMGHGTCAFSGQSRQTFVVSSRPVYKSFMGSLS